MLLLRYTDRPGIVGKVGQSLGSTGINIASMQVARDSQGGEALMAITVDSTIPTGVVDQVKKDTGADSVVSVSLVN